MPTVILWGAPCSGKSTHIAERAQADDIIIDLDRLALALAPEDTDHHRYAQHHRDLARLARRGITDQAAAWGTRQPNVTVWIIDSNANPAARRRWRSVGASVVKLDTPRDVCHARAAQHRPPETAQLIDEWFARHAVTA
jgi:predicted kinase